MARARKVPNQSNLDSWKWTKEGETKKKKERTSWIFLGGAAGGKCRKWNSKKEKYLCIHNINLIRRIHLLAFFVFFCGCFPLRSSQTFSSVPAIFLFAYHGIIIICSIRYLLFFVQVHHTFTHVGFERLAANVLQDRALLVV